MKFRNLREVPDGRFPENLYGLPTFLLTSSQAQFFSLQNLLINLELHAIDPKARLHRVIEKAKPFLDF